MTIKHYHKTTTRNRKNREWLQWTGKSEKPGNNTKTRITYQNGPLRYFTFIRSNING